MAIQQSTWRRLAPPQIEHELDRKRIETAWDGVQDGAGAIPVLLLPVEGIREICQLLGNGHPI